MIDPTLKSDIQELLDDYAEKMMGCIETSTFAEKAEDLLKRVLEEPVDHFPVGTRVRHTQDKGYLGTVTGTTTFYAVKDSRGHFKGEYLSTSLEVAPDLDSETVWSEVTLLVMREVQRAAHANGNKAIYEYDRRPLRGECYRLIGGAKIEVDGKVKERVRSIITQVADTLGIDQR